MESEQFESLLKGRDGVKKEANALMVELLAEHLMSASYKRVGGDAIPNEDPLAAVYQRLEQSCTDLLTVYRERMALQGLQGNLRNFSICKALAGLKLEIDMMERIFSSQNIEASYKLKLRNEFKKAFE